MASIAESSVGSLPHAKIAQLKEHFLQGRVVPEANDDTTERDGRDTRRDDEQTAETTGEDGPVSAESAQPYRTPVSSPKADAAPVSLLESAKSAPPAAMEQMVHPSPSQEVFEAMTRASSFPGGDTQLNESQVWEDYNESRAQLKSGTTPRKEKVLLQFSPYGMAQNTYETEATGRTPQTLQPGERGYVDLDGALEEMPLSPTAAYSSDLGDSVNGDSQEKQQPMTDALFRKPDLPETPGLAGHKRKRSGDFATSQPSSRKTPGFAQAFDFKTQAGAILTGTQLFEQTQNRSSPNFDAPRSDPAITRPSPNIPNQFNVSSPPVMMSSPIYARAPPATAGGPRERYTTYKESQERKKIAQLERDYHLRRRSGDSFVESYDSQNTQEMRDAQQRLRRTMSDHNLQLGSVSARSKLGSRPATSSSPRKSVTIDLRTPAPGKSGLDWNGDASDDEGVDQEASDDEPIAEDGEDRAVDELQEDNDGDGNDEYDELGQTVLRSQEAEPGDDKDETARDDSDDETDLAGEENGHVGSRAQVTLIQDSSQQDLGKSHRTSQMATQHSAIADSQPLRNDVQVPNALQQEDAARSPSCSYVPGSQYAGRTSQEQALASTRRSHQSVGPPILSASKSQDVEQQVVPSSPPLGTKTASAVHHTAEASLERRKMLDQFQAESEQHQQAQTEQEIPESDVPAPEHGASHSTTAEGTRNTDSNNVLFSTARSHQSTSGPSRSQGLPAPSALDAFGSQHSKIPSQSPRTRAGVRRFADITGQGEPPKGSADALAEVDALMDGLINDEDQHFLEATSSPPRERPQKRARRTGMPSIQSSSPVKQADSSARETEVPTENAVPNEEGHEMPEQTRSEPANLEARALRNSPSKANEQRAISPAPESTPESVKLREQAGSKAASQLLAKRSSRPAKRSRSSNTTRKATSKLQEQATSEEIDQAPRTGRSARRTSHAPPTDQHDHQSDDAADQRHVAEPEIAETVVESREDIAEPQQQKEALAIVAPQRVFALFKGTFNMFYPATWLGVSGAGGHRVRFDDGTVTSIEPHLVARMELALGDQIKVDYPGMKNKVWIVKGFGPVLSANAAQERLTDMHGHETVKVQAKSTRNSVSGPQVVAQGEGEIVNMAVEVVYLTQTIWTSFASREFQPGGRQGHASRLETPSTGVQTPLTAETPTSRSRTNVSYTVKALEKRGSSLREDSTGAVKIPKAGIFQGMALAVSYSHNEGEKATVMRLIQRNGGTIIEDGFEGFFSVQELDELEPASPSGKSARGAATDSAPPSSLHLKAEHKNLGFVALIADRHSRRAKYIQSLALGIPTLSGRWVLDSLDAAKNTSLSSADATPLPWTKYVLAAGESAYLNGAIRSRDLATYDARTAKLADTVSNRPLLLNGDGVLIVASKKSKVAWERKKPFAFLTLALGAGHVKRVSDLTEAKSHVTSEPEKWKFVYVDGSVADASAAVFGKGAAGAHGKKRKREDAPATKVDAKAMCATDGQVRIVNDEFVVQSLILGALVD